MGSGRRENLATVWRAGLRLARDCRGQDMIEYALMAAFVAVAVAGILPPSLPPAISTVFSKVTSVLGLIP